MLEIVPQAYVNRQFPRKRPVILHETTEAGHREIDVRISKSMHTQIEEGKEEADPDDVSAGIGGS